MNRKPRTPEQEVTTLDSFIVDSVNFFADGHDIYDSIRTFQRLRFEWMNPGAITRQDGKESAIADMEALQTLLIDIAEARAKYNQMVLDRYEQD